MAKEIIREREIVDTNDTSKHAAETATDQGPVAVASKVVYVIFSILITLLLLRFIFALLGANPANGIVDALYDITRPFIAPFANFFTNADNVTLAAGSRFEIETLVAIVFYLLIGWIITRLVGVFDARERV